MRGYLNCGSGDIQHNPCSKGEAAMRGKII
jgi:hypothetical protein